MAGHGGSLPIEACVDAGCDGVSTALANRLIRIGTVGEFQVNYVWADFAGAL